jgi:hypothetical protein
MDFFSRGLVKTSCVRERDAPATAGETPALQMLLQEEDDEGNSRS